MRKFILFAVLFSLIFITAHGLGEPPKIADRIQQLTPEQAEAMRMLLNLPPGTKVDMELRNTDEGSTTVTETGKGVGAGARAQGDKLDGAFTGTPPNVGLTGAGNASGGGADSRNKASGLFPQTLPWANPLFWIGLALIAGAGAVFYFRVPTAKTTAPILLVAGGGCLTAAFYPALLIWAMVGVVIFLAWPYIKAKLAEIEAKRKLEEEKAAHDSTKAALTATVKGVDDPSLAPEVKEAVKARIAAHASSGARNVIREVKVQGEVGKFAR